MPAQLELTNDTSHDEIEAYVEQVVADVAADRQGDKSDAQVIAEERDKPVTDTAAEDKSGSDDTADKGEETAAADDRAWLDDELKADASAYGIDETELAEFTSREELERALRFFDRSTLEAGRKALAAKETEKPRDEQGRFSKGAAQEEVQAGRYEISLSKDIYDEDLVDELTRLRDHYETRLGAMEARFAEADALARQQQFDAAVDAMGHADLFGKTGSEKPQELQRRQDLFLACEAMLTGLQSQGRQVGSYESLVSRQARGVFAEELDKKNLKARTREAQDQSRRRSGDSATKSPSTPESLRDEFRRRYKQLENA